jgi:hypothetical protein
MLNAMHNENLSTSKIYKYKHENYKNQTMELKVL